MNKKSITALSIFIFGVLALPAYAGGSAPSYIGKIKLGFQQKALCELADFKASKKSDKKKADNSVMGRANISHDESSISWTSSCIISLPKTVKYCALSSQHVENPDAFVSWDSGFQKKVLRSKIVSESDINPSFGKFSVTYLCFE